MRVPHGPGRRTGPGIECRGQEGGSVEGARGGLQREEREEGSPPPGSGDPAHGPLRRHRVLKAGVGTPGDGVASGRTGGWDTGSGGLAGRGASCRAEEPRVEQRKEASSRSNVPQRHEVDAGWRYLNWVSFARVLRAF